MITIDSTYSDDEFKALQEYSQKAGFSLSEFQKYMSLLYLDLRPSDLTIDDLKYNNLKKELDDRLNKIAPSKTFIVSSLLPDKWVYLNRNEKRKLSNYLSKKVKDDPSQYNKISQLGSTNLYKKLK